MSCERCVHAMPYPAPDGPEPEKPDVKTMSCGLSGGYLLEYHYRQWIKWIERNTRFETKVECRRFPEFVERKKTDGCGEFAPDPFGLDDATPIAGE